MDGEWHLTLFERDGPTSSRIHQGRALTADEVDALRAATRVVGTMLASNLLTPFMDVTDRLRTIVNRVLDPPTARVADTQTKVDWSMALDVWLVYLVMYRRRMEREVERVLGPEAGEHARGVFQSLWEDDEAFRFGWDWRNEAQHHLNPLDITSVNAEATPDGGSDISWVLNPDSEARLGHRWADSSLAMIRRGAGCARLVGAVVTACSRAWSEVLIRNENAIGQAADTILDACKGVLSMLTPETKMPITMAAMPAPRLKDGTDPDGPREWDLSILTLRHDHAVGAMVAVNDARRFLRLPPKFDLPAPPESA